jgi:hypothetical protein
MVTRGGGFEAQVLVDLGLLERLLDYARGAVRPEVVDGRALSSGEGR